MNSSSDLVHRATIDDLPELMRLWREAQLPAALLEQRFTEFQVAVSPTGELMAAIGLHLAGKQGILHSEVFADPAHDDEYRDLIWARMRVLGCNHGLARIWSQETAPFWGHSGFKPAGKDLLAKLPPAYAEEAGAWFSLQLIDEEKLAKSVDKELAVFMEAEKNETEQTIERVKFLRNIIIGIGFIIVGVFIYMAVSALYPRFRQRLPGGGMR